jgi:hypothetical protein
MQMLPTDALMDLFILYANAERSSRIVLGCTDTMYKRRLGSGRGLDSLNRAGFARMMTDAPGLTEGLTIDLDYIFMENLGACGCCSSSARRSHARACRPPPAARRARPPAPLRTRLCRLAQPGEALL